MPRLTPRQGTSVLLLLSIALFSAGLATADSTSGLRGNGFRGNGAPTGEYDNADCLSCHEDEELDPETERGEGLRLFVD